MFEFPSPRPPANLDLSTSNIIFSNVRLCIEAAAHKRTLQSSAGKECCSGDAHRRGQETSFYDSSRLQEYTEPPFRQQLAAL